MDENKKAKFCNIFKCGLFNDCEISDTNSKECLEKRMYATDFMSGWNPDNYKVIEGDDFDFF